MRASATPEKGTPAPAAIVAPRRPLGCSKDVCYIEGGTSGANPLKPIAASRLSRSPTDATAAGRAALSPVSVISLLSLLIAGRPAAAAGAAPGGFVESATSTNVRPPVTLALPSRGKFTFPSPYNTSGIRVTNASDCGNADCVLDVGYSYWRNMNSHAGSDVILIFLTLDRAKGGGGPTLFSYNKVTDQVTVVGPLFDASNPLSWATAEGWYWSATRPTILYITSGSSLYRYDVSTRQMDLVADASTYFGSDRYIWQTHVSNNDTILLRDVARQRDVRVARLPRLQREQRAVLLLRQDGRIR